METQQEGNFGPLNAKKMMNYKFRAANNDNRNIFVPTDRNAKFLTRFPATRRSPGGREFSKNSKLILSLSLKAVFCTLFLTYSRLLSWCMKTDYVEPHAELHQKGSHQKTRAKKKGSLSNKVPIKWNTGWCRMVFVILPQELANNIIDWRSSSNVAWLTTVDWDCDSLIGRGRENVVKQLEKKRYYFT